MKAEQKTPLFFCYFKYYPHICNAKSNDSKLSRCVRLTLNTKLGFFYVHRYPV